MGPLAGEQVQGPVDEERVGMAGMLERRSWDQRGCRRNGLSMAISQPGQWSPEIEGGQVR